MNKNLRRPEPTKRHRLFNPDDYVVPGANFVIAKIMVKANFFNLARFKKGDCLTRPIDSNPTLRRFAQVIKEYSHEIWWLYPPNSLTCERARMSAMWNVV